MATPSSSPKNSMATSKPSSRSPSPSILNDTLVFAGGATIVVLVFWTVYSFIPPDPTTISFPSTTRTQTQTATTSFYEDPNLSYSIDDELSDWDEKRRIWLEAHPKFVPGAKDRIFMVTGSQAGPCKNPIGDHLLLRFYKNKADYCRLHGLDLFYNTALLQPSMFTFWAKIPVIRAAMVAHPEAEWIWWVDSDALFTDMEFVLPLRKYASHNLVVHGWPEMVFGKKSWVGLNAGVFLIRNCQWSLDFMRRWAAMGPQSPEYESWGKTLKSEFKDKLFEESDDQSGLVYILLHEQDKWGKKIFLERDFYFEGYWVEIVGKLEKIAEKYLEMEKRSPELRQRNAEKLAAAANAKVKEEHLKAEKMETGRDGWRRPFVTHFTGCQPCSGNHNTMYSGESCWDGMLKALNFADDQVLRAYGFRHAALVGNHSGDVRPLPFDFPASS